MSHPLHDQQDTKEYLNLADVSDIFYFFSARGGGRGSPRPPGGGGVDFLLKIPEGGGSPGGEGAEGPGGCLRRIGDFGGGGAKYFFRGRNVHYVNQRGT